MRKCRNWALSLAMMAGAPAAAFADLPFKSLAAPARAAGHNQQVAEEIGAAIKSSKLSYTGLRISFDKGVCSLQGQVPDARTKAEMLRTVQNVAGVESVDDQLVVAKPSREASKDVAAAEPARRGVRSADYQKAPAERAAIERVGLNVPTSVPEAPSGKSRQQQVADEIKSGLMAAGLSGHNVRINVVEDGKATLSGTVASPEARARFEQVARAVPGVKSVSNKLAVDSDDADPGYADARRAQLIRAGYQDPQAPNGAPLGAPAGPAGPMPPGPPMPGGAYAPPPGYGPGHGAPPGYGPGYGAPSGYGPPPAYGQPPMTGVPSVYDQPGVPEYAWPSYAQYPNYAAVNYPKQYSASAWPYIGPFYPYPQVPLGWRAAQLEWKDGYWHLNFKPRTERWWWYLDPRNWTED